MPILPKLVDALHPGRVADALPAGARIELVVAIVLAVAAVGAFLDPAPLGNDSPKAAVQAYFSGEARRDIAAVTAATEVRTDLVGSVDASLLDDKALKAELASHGAHLASVQVGEPTVTGNTATAEVAFRAADATRHAKLTLNRVFPALRLHGIWKVRLEPKFFEVQIPVASGDLTVDGLAVHLPPGRLATVAVLPGPHVLSTTGGALIAGESVPYCPAGDLCYGPGVAAAGPAQKQTIALGLTSAGKAAAAKAVTAAFASCSGAATPGPTACPQTFSAFGSPSISWTVVGDPNRESQLGVDPATGSVQVSGHYQIVAAADYGGGRLIHEASSGGYSLHLKPSGTAFTPGPITSATVPPATRPAEATDQMFLDVVRAAVTKCFPMPASYVPDCPQPNPANATNLSWSLEGDPIAGAVVSFDPDANIYLVVGKVTSRVQYDPVLLGIALPHVDNTYEEPYHGQLFWSGQEPVLVTLVGP